MNQESEEKKNTHEPSWFSILLGLGPYERTAVIWAETENRIILISDTPRVYVTERQPDKKKNRMYCLLVESLYMNIGYMQYQYLST